MTGKEQRAEIRSITRGQLRYLGYEPSETSSDGIIRTVDELARKGGRVADWYLSASDSQVKILVREIRKGVM